MGFAEDATSSVEGGSGICWYINRELVRSILERAKTVFAHSVSSTPLRGWENRLSWAEFLVESIPPSTQGASILAIKRTLSLCLWRVSCLVAWHSAFRLEMGP